MCGSRRQIKDQNAEPKASRQSTVSHGRTTMLEAQSGRLISADFPARPSAGTNAFSALQVPAGSWASPQREPLRFGSRIPIRSGDTRSPSMPEPPAAAGPPPRWYPERDKRRPPGFVIRPLSFAALRAHGRFENSSWRSSRSGGRPQLQDAITFVQQLKRQNAARARNSLFLWTQGVMRFLGPAYAQNSGTIRATRPLGRGTV
jgi:hypothetical protein